MQPAQRLTTPHVLPRVEEVRRLVRENLWGDWIIRIEYATGHSGSSGRWQQWGDAFFAVSDPETVIEALVACWTKYAGRSIRISAEKVRPQTRLVYCVHKAAEGALHKRPRPLPVLVPLATRKRAQEVVAGAGAGAARTVRPSAGDQVALGLAK